MLIDAVDTGPQVSDLGRFSRTPPRKGPAEAEHLIAHGTRHRRVAGRLHDVDQIPDEYAWMLRGSCRGAQTRAFFPSDGVGVEAVQRICRSCAVRDECLEYALLHRIEQGVWGGASERERRRILRERRRANALPT